MLASIGHGLANLARFSGRDTRERFWPYALAVLVVAFAAMFLSFGLGFAGSFQKTIAYAEAHPDKATVTRSGGSVSVTIHEPTPELMPDMAPMFMGLRLGAPVIVALLAAAVVRRLRDAGRSGLWGLPPVVFLGIALVLFPRLFEGFMAGDEHAFDLFPPLLANNFAYLASLGLLVFLLCRDSKPEAKKTGGA
ncbi:DUF805 domain-containing protein [Caulobacter endophyticus]|uniref:DUF805 domain-containing protein n=1 Tax=Caulobacter endophyticus TaxID=2172652 RepID=A0A2T9JJC0_9CAUL|nr:DUF805 domain-containing protein [Caulobacter endophyticus]PVM83801.1 hypothetical protein DDF67_20230 [Caulobacter endophyticus]